LRTHRLESHLAPLLLLLLPAAASVGGLHNHETQPAICAAAAAQSGEHWPWQNRP
jgi:hypothetical protein